MEHRDLPKNTQEETPTPEDRKPVNTPLAGAKILRPNVARPITSPQGSDDIRRSRISGVISPNKHHNQSTMACITGGCYCSSEQGID